MHLLQYSFSCRSAYLQVLSAFLKKHLHGQRGLKYLLSAVITTDQEMRIIHLLETLAQSMLDNILPHSGFSSKL